MLKGSVQNTAYLYQAMKDYPNAVTYFKKYAHDASGRLKRQ